MTEEAEFEDRPSKSQRKRDMETLRKLAERLTELSNEQLQKIEDTAVREAIFAATKITKGNARKRQLQYTAKLMSKINVAPIQKIVDSLDASSAAYVQKFHQLEIWRERLISGGEDVYQEILARFPRCDRQQLRQLTRSAIAEQEKGDHQVQFRKLFQFLKKLENDQEDSE